MGVYIKGIEIPNDNFVTVVAIYRNPKTERIYAEWTDELGIHHGIKLVEISTPHGRLIDANKLEAMMYHEAFEIDSDMQKWDSGCWIRYKVFENCMNRLLPDTIIEAEE